jgi:tetratricopeptide (TPR) repeat protein
MPKAAWLMGALLVIGVVLAYQPAWQAGYIWDDDVYVTQNRLLTAPDGLKRIWFSGDSPSQYFPLTYTALRVEHGLWGLKPAGYHWVNILLHAINALVLWRLLGRLRIPGAWLAAAIFALHPVQVESVAWITELKNVLSFFFFLLSLWAWVEFIEPTPKPRWLYYALALVFCALALFSKTTACTLPAALLLVVWLKKQPVNWPRCLQVAPFLGMGVGMGLLTVWWEHTRQGTFGKMFEMSLAERVLVASHAIWFYAGKLIWPVNLMFSYPRWNINPAAPAACGWLLAAAAAGAVIYFGRRWAGRGPEVAALFYAATLSPVLGFIMLYTFRYSFVADHYQYIASIGPLTLAAAAISRLGAAWNKHSRMIGAIICAALLPALGTLTWRQARIYAGSETLWRATVARNPTSTIAHNNLANALLEKGALDESIAQSRLVLEINPNDANALNNLGGAFLLKGRLNDAIEYSQKSIAAQPLSAKPYYNLGQAFLQRGQVDAAITNLQKAIELKPDFAQAFCNLGFALLKQGKTAAAVGDYQKALELEPDYALAHNDLGHILLDLGRPDQALEHFQRAAQVEPGFFEAHFNRGQALVKMSRLDEAAAEFEKALALHPSLPEAQYQLGNIFRRQGRFADAVAHYAAALQIRPDYLPACNNLAWVLATCPDGTVRDGAKAVQLASLAERLSAGRDPMVVGTLAAAYAQAGRFPEAIATVGRALAAATDRTNSALAAVFRAQLALYQKGSPVRDTAK